MKLRHLFLIGLCFVAMVSSFEAMGAKGKVLVVLSAEKSLRVYQTYGGGKVHEHPTGFFLSELMIPVMAIQKDYEVVFATPGGVEPRMDEKSDKAFYFQSKEEHEKAKKTLGELKGMKTPEALADVPKKFKLDEFVGIFVPGGHAPMVDLWATKALGTLLRHFHGAKKPTASVCHGPIALLSAAEDYLGIMSMTKSKRDVVIENTLLRRKALTQKLNDEENKKLAGHPAMLQGFDEELKKLSKGWPYAGYRMTSFSTKEEQTEEPEGMGNSLGGYMPFYPDEALANAGGKVVVNANPWQSLVVRHEELITGQNPQSGHELAKTFVDALDAYTKKK